MSSVLRFREEVGNGIFENYDTTKWLREEVENGIFEYYDITKMAYIKLPITIFAIIQK